MSKTRENKTRERERERENERERKRETNVQHINKGKMSFWIDIATEKYPHKSITKTRGGREVKEKRRKYDQS